MEFGNLQQCSFAFITYLTCSDIKYLEYIMASTRSKAAAGKAANNAPSGRSERDGKPVSL